ncbi:helix-turn-helix domain-containing protein [Streptomyces sp. WM6378]|uniref:helix-turn-helix domain-containing protein n=1 Tax=Streptomyces sp. WM6378 TaxID=1415557 RepID=UPI0006AE32F4|nr:helix-turn-helix transcriptional regulator [Streptomyces sp. WM6378]
MNPSDEAVTPEGIGVADELEVVLSSVNDLIKELGYAPDGFNIDRLVYRTGIPADQVEQLLNGAPADEPENLHSSVHRRLVFLRDTRRRPDGAEYSYDEIAVRLGISRAQVYNVFTAKRNPGLQVTVELEKFFRVEAGFLTLTDRQALARALKPIREQLTYVAMLKNRGVGYNQLALRSALATEDDAAWGKELMAALGAAMDRSEQEQELQELTDSVRALPSRSRRRIIPLMRGMLGLTRADEDPASDSKDRP